MPITKPPQQPPPQNCVINACAGSGKTHALIQRLLLLLKNGAAPGEILAITFTRKAAEEIKTRLLNELQKCAQQQEEWAARCRRRILFAETPADELNIHTFHGWFGVLLKGGGWTPGWFGPADLTEDTAQLAARAWQRWLAAPPPPAPLTAVMAHCTPASLQALMAEGDGVIHHLNAYRLLADKTLTPPREDEANAALRQTLQTFLAFFTAARPGGAALNKVCDAGAHFYSFKENNDDGNNDSNNNNEAEARWRALEQAIFTAKGDARQRLLKDAEKIHGGAGSEPLSMLITAAREYARVKSEIRACRFHHHMLALADSYVQIFEQVKNEQHLLTFDDLEYKSYQAVCKNGDVNELLERTNNRFCHILIDEFQDTSPLQWQIIYRWLLAASGSENAPSVFIVGDKKQAIYRFRHGDMRLLKQAEDFLRDYYQAAINSHNICYRLAPALVALVNHVFPPLLGKDFTPHEAAENNSDRRGYVEWRKLPWQKEEPPAKGAAPTLRNPLAAARAEDTRRLHWADIIARRVSRILAHWRLQDDAAGEDRAHTRRARAEDILVLLPAFTHVHVLRQALQRRGLPCSLRGGGVNLLSSLACRDIAALLKFLLWTDNSLSLAKVLRSPLVALSDEAFAALTRAPGAALWQKTRAAQNAAAQKLQRWRGWALRGDLSAHDLLQKIFADGDVFARYRAAVPPPERQQVCEELSALLDFSLANDSGKQPLCEDFLTALDGAGAEERMNGIRLMTIHSAKGLEAPIVILADCALDKKYSGGGRQSARLLINWPPQDAAPAKFIFCPAEEKTVFEDMRAEEDAREEAEYNNLFYVALTRAKQALLVFSLGDTDSNPRIAAFAAAMQTIGTAAAAAAEGDGGGGDDDGDDDGECYIFGDTLAADDTPLAAHETLAAADNTDSAAAAFKEGSILPINVATLRKEGSVLHQQIALLLLGYEDEAIRRLFPAAAALFQRAKKLLQNARLQQLLQTATRYQVESEIFHDGQLRRLDLLIFTADAVWVVDYKTGGGDLARYQQQLGDYRAAVRAVYNPPAVKAALLTADGFFEQDEA